MNLDMQRKTEKPAFNRTAVFSAVDESNQRFARYSKERRRAYAEVSRSLSVLKPNATVRRAGH